jgi:competence protein ComEC
MFSFVAIGNHLRRSDNIYHFNRLHVIDFAFRTIVPFDVGFQLSYLALFFIICCNRY